MTKLIQINNNLAKIAWNKNQAKNLLLNSGYPIIDLVNNNETLIEQQITNNLNTFQILNPKIYDFLINCINKINNNNNSIKIKDISHSQYMLTINRNIIDYYLDKNTFFKLLDINHSVYFEHNNIGYTARLIVTECKTEIITNNLGTFKKAISIGINLPKGLFYPLVEKKFIGEGFINIPQNLYNSLEGINKKKKDILYKLFLYSQLKNTHKKGSRTVNTLELIKQITNETRLIGKKEYLKNSQKDICNYIQNLIKNYNDIEISDQSYKKINNLYVEGENTILYYK